MVKPLIEAQEFVEEFKIYCGEAFDIDMDKIRMEIFTNSPNGSLNRWPFYVYPQMACDLSGIYIQTDNANHFNSLLRDNRTWFRSDDLYDTAIINFTPRYRNRFIDYHFLKQYESKIVFAGTEKEREAFCVEWGLNLPLLHVEDFKQLAAVIKSCKFFAGNASMCFQIAEGLKVPRILETYHVMPNVIPIGEKAFDFYHQGGLEYYFEKLNK